MSRTLIRIALLLALHSPVPAQALPPPLSQTDLHRLSRGEILFRDRLPPADGVSAGSGGTALALLHADPEEVWRILTDFSHYAGLFPRLRESEVIAHEGPYALIRFHVGVGPFNFRFSVAHFVSPEARQIRWRLDRSQANDLFLDTWGYWQLDLLPGGRVLVTYAMGSKTVLPAFLTRGAERESVVKTVEALKARVEQTRRSPTS